MLDYKKFNAFALGSGSGVLTGVTPVYISKLNRLPCDRLDFLRQCFDLTAFLPENWRCRASVAPPVENFRQRA